MLNKRNLSSVGWPALALFIVTLLIQGLIVYYTHFSFYIFDAISLCIAGVICEVFAYMTCWSLVIRKKKDDNWIWINYIVWMLIMNLGSVADFLGG